MERMRAGLAWGPLSLGGRTEVKYIIYTIKSKGASTQACQPSSPLSPDQHQMMSADATDDLASKPVLGEDVLRFAGVERAKKVLMARSRLDASGL